MIVRELVTKWGFEVEDHKLHKVEQSLEGIKHRLEFLAGVEIVKGLFELTEKFAHFGEELHVAAVGAGLTVEAFQKLSFAASQSAVSQDELGRSLRILSRHLYDARIGVEQSQKAFRAVGLDPHAFKTSQEAVLALADKFQKIQDPIKKTALAQELMGRGSIKMVAFLSQGSDAIRGQATEAERLGLVLKEHQVEALISVEHALLKVYGLFKAIAATIAASVAPLFEYLINDFIKFVGVNRKLVETNFEQWLVRVAYGMGFVWGLIQVGILLLVKLAKAFHVEKDIFSIVAGVASAVVSLFILLRVFGLLKSTISAVLGVFSLFSSALKVITALEWATILPWLLWPVAIAAVVLGLQAIWAMFTGKQSWAGMFWEWLKSFDAVKNAIAGVKGINKSLFEAGKAATERAGVSATGIPGSKPGELGLPSFTPTPGVEKNATMFNIEAPVTVTVPPGTPAHEVGTKVKEGISDALAQIMREASRSTAGAISH